jgi:glycerate kinase
VQFLVAADKFRGTLSAAEATAAVAQTLVERRHTAVEIPLSDGGEGFLEAFGGSNRTTTVTGPLGEPVQADWRFDNRTAVIEMAHAAGLTLAGGPAENDPLGATTAGVGDLINAALDAGAKRILIGLGGSATTDGGLGALERVKRDRLRGVELVVACDVSSPFTQAAALFAEQKGASPAQVALLERRLQSLAERFRGTDGIDVDSVRGSGAAGGLAGGLLTLGAELVPGFELVAEEVGFFDAIESAGAVVTGEGLLDTASFDGKVVGGVTEAAAHHHLPTLVIVGDAEIGLARPEHTVSLVERFGPDRAKTEPAICIQIAVNEWLDHSTFDA